MPTMLDLFCGAGGAAMGYHRAGFSVTGVDAKPMKRFPFTFVRGDALEFVSKHGSEFDSIHASPPCQGYSKLNGLTNRDMSNYAKLIDETRAALMETGKPWVIENVIGAKLHNPLKLCGTMFGLKTHRHRLFETHPWPIWFPQAVCNGAKTKPAHSSARLAQYYGANAPMVTVAGHQFSRTSGSLAMGIDWMTRDELAEAIPPAYTEYIGRWLIAFMAGEHAPV